MKMRFGVGMGRNESVNEVGELARLAEDCGVEHVTLVDEPFLARDVFTGLAVVAMNTDPGVTRRPGRAFPRIRSKRLGCLHVPVLEASGLKVVQPAPGNRDPVLQGMGIRALLAHAQHGIELAASPFEKPGAVVARIY